MKKLLLIFILALLLPSCDKDSDSSSDTSYRVTAGGVTAFNSPDVEFDYTFSTFGPGSAIIYNGVISGTNYIGLALGDNSNELFGLYIYFPWPNFPTSFPTVISDIQSIPGAIIKARNGVTEYIGVGGTLSLEFTAKNTAGTYITYTITPTASSLTINAIPVVFNVATITALFVGTNP